MELYYWKCEIVNIYENQLGSESVGNRRRHLDMRSIYARCGADATVNRTGERWRGRKAAPMHRGATLAWLWFVLRYYCTEYLYTIV
jgi:hypothetical protein